MEFASMDARLYLDVGFPCSIYSRSRNEWSAGIIDDIYIDENTNKEWLIVKYGNNQTKRIQRFCNDIQAIEDFIDIQKDPRMTLHEGSTCEVYSRSKDMWFIGIVHEIYIDEETTKEWLVIKYGPEFGKTKKMQRFCQDLQVNDEEYEYEKMEEIDVKITEVADKLPQTKPKPEVINGWMKLSPLTLPKTLFATFSSMIPINDTEFMITTSIGQHALANNYAQGSSNGIYKYNTTHNNWDFTPIKLAQFGPLPLMQSIALFAFDAVTKDVYIGGLGSSSYNGRALFLKIKLKESTDGKVHAESLRYVQYGYTHDSDRGNQIMQEMQILYVNDEVLHIVGPNGQNYDDSLYSVWDTKNKQRVESETISMIHDSVRDWKQSVYIKSEHKVLGFSSDGFIWSFDLAQRTFAMLENVRLPDVMSENPYRIKYDACITTDEKYIIFMPQCVILDLETMEFIVKDRSDVKLPEFGDEKEEFQNIRDPVCLIMPGFLKDEKIIIGFGFARDLSIEIPRDIIELISYYWFKDYLYFMDRDWAKQPQLWKIFVDDILTAKDLTLDVQTTAFQTKVR